MPVRRSALIRVSSIFVIPTQGKYFLPLAPFGPEFVPPFWPDREPQMQQVAQGAATAARPKARSEKRTPKVNTENRPGLHPRPGPFERIPDAAAPVIQSPLSTSVRTLTLRATDAVRRTIPAVRTFSSTPGYPAR